MAETIQKITPVQFSVYDQEQGIMYDLHSVDQNGECYPDDEWEIIVSGHQRPGNVVNVRDFSPLIKDAYEETLRMAEDLETMDRPFLYDEGVAGE